jgi:hypothetical protein
MSLRLSLSCSKRSAVNETVRLGHVFSDNHPTSGRVTQSCIDRHYSIVNGERLSRAKSHSHTGIRTLTNRLLLLKARALRLFSSAFASTAQSFDVEAPHDIRYSHTTNMSTTTTTTTVARGVSAEEILRLFPDVNPTIIGVQATRTDSGDELAGYDEEQVRLMEEVCIVIDEDDKPIGSGSKLTCWCSSAAWCTI